MEKKLWFYDLQIAAKDWYLANGYELTVWHSQHITKDMVYDYGQFLDKEKKVVRLLFFYNKRQQFIVYTQTAIIHI
jgi:hypothetical protein